MIYVHILTLKTTRVIVQSILHGDARQKLDIKLNNLGNDKFNDGRHEGISNIYLSFIIPTLKAAFKLPVWQVGHFEQYQ